MAKAYIDDSELFELMRTLDFTPEDLRANRAGHLSEKQHSRFNQLSKTYRELMFIYIFVAPVLPCGFTLYLTDTSYISMLCLGWLIFMPLGLVLFFLRYRRADATVKHPNVQLTQGQVNIQKNILSNHIQIDEAIFKVSAEIVSSFEQAKVYKIYHTMHNQIMSAEPLGDNLKSQLRKHTHYSDNSLPKHLVQ